MPKQKRWEIKRDIEQARDAIVRSQEYLVRTGALFENHPSGYYDDFAQIVTVLEKCVEAAMILHDKI